MHVPRFGTGYQPRPVLEGTSQTLLKDGVGHYPGTALPGAVGNVALAGHRVTYGKPFNQVAELVTGDAVVLETEEAWFTYRVTTSEIVGPRDVDVIAPVPGDPTAVPTERMLTLTTCHPMFSARERYVVHAVLDGWQPRSAGEPASADRGTDRRCRLMYSALWRVLPGPRWVRALVLLALALAVVAACFEWVFPAVAPYVPFNETTVGEQ